MSRIRLAQVLRALPRRLRRAADRLGRPGLVGAAILATSIGYYAGAIQPLARQIDTLQAARSNAQRPAVRAPGSDPGEQLRQFVATFPEERELAHLLTRLYAVGEREGVRLAQGDYRFIEADALGMVQYKVMLPVSGTYPRIRHFVGTVLADALWPTLSRCRLRASARAGSTRASS